MGGTFMEQSYVGHALVRAGRGGRVRLPEFVRRVLDRRPSPLFIGLHPRAPCLIAYDRRQIEALSSALALRDLAADVPDDDQHALSRRLFGTSEEIGWPCETVRLPDFIRRRVGIADAVLFIGTGTAVEIWAPDAAAGSGDEVLQDIAAYHLTTAAQAA